MRPERTRGQPWLTIDATTLPGSKPSWRTVNYTSSPQHTSYAPTASTPTDEQKDLVGVDVFLDWHSGTPDQLGEAFKQVGSNGLELTMITNRGAKVWPGGMPETFTTDHWRCRFLARNRDEVVSHSQIIKLLQRIDEAGFDFIKIENLYNFNGKASYSAGQGE